MTIDELKQLKESEDNIEYKAAHGGNYAYNGGNKAIPRDRRRCILGYTVALANEGGGYLVFGMSDNHPHNVVGSSQNLGRIGLLESNIYRDLSIRVKTYELYENDKRVLVISVPSRPVGRYICFEDVPLMRVGEELLPMSQEKQFEILKEQEPDFSALFCKQINIDDLDETAISKLKRAYAEKNKNHAFLTLDNKQALNDLDLYKGGELTNAALLLLGKNEKIKEIAPQSRVFLEFRENDGDIPFDNRYEFAGPYYNVIEEIWDRIDTRNKRIHIQEGPYIFDIPQYNKEVIREAINNAIAHRDYTKTSEIVIKLYPNKLEIINPGGFPLGVTLENLLTVNSTPRNRLLAEVLAKTGIVERSGQGIDKIFKNCISEAKGLPNYGASDYFQVHLEIPAKIQDEAFALFIKDIQTELPDNKKLSVFEILELEKIRKGVSKNELNDNIIKFLLEKNLVEKKGKTKGVYYVLSKTYYEYTNQQGIYSRLTERDEKQALYTVMSHFEQFPTAKMGDFADLFEGKLSRRQVKYLVEKMVERKELDKKGKGSGTTYSVGENFKQTMAVLQKAIKLGIEQMRENGELPK